MSLVIALAFVGVGYGLWSKVLFIDGTVETGNVNAVFDSTWTDDQDTSQDPPGHEKHVARCEATIDGEDTQIMHITVLNGYPSYRCTVWFDIMNTGSIPVKVQAYNLTGVPVELEVEQTGLPIGTQMEPEGKARGDLHIHVLQEAKEYPASYSFSATITLVQWNEYNLRSGVMTLCQKDSDWKCIPGATGVLYYNTSGWYFDYDFDAEGLVKDTDYTLIYYPDPWPADGLICIDSGVADVDGDLILSGSNELGISLPISTDDNHPGGAKIWLVPSGVVDCDVNKMIGWTPSAYLFEETLITYADTGP